MSKPWHLNMRSRVGGVLLAEALLCTLLVASVLAVMAAAITTWERSLLNSRERAGAYLVTKQQMEYCLGLDYDELELADTAGTPKVFEVKRTVGTHQIDSVYETSVAVRLLPSERVKSVEVLTTFRTDKGVPVRLYTLVYQTS